MEITVGSLVLHLIDGRHRIILEVDNNTRRFSAHVICGECGKAINAQAEMNAPRR